MYGHADAWAVMHGQRWGSAGGGAHPASVDTRDMLPAMAVAAALSAAGRPGLRSLLTPPPGVKVAVSVKVSRVWRNLLDMPQVLASGGIMVTDRKLMDDLYRAGSLPT